MLSQKHIEIVKSTVPLLENAGTDLTDHFYQRMFEHNPELKHIFNLSNQHTGRQQVALFEAIAAYANNIDNLTVLKSAVERIAHKHTSFDIQPEHYQIVGHHIIKTLSELAGDAFNAEVEEAWVAAFNLLASIFIGRERELYDQSANSNGGWQGKRRFELVQKSVESELVTSFVFAPLDGKAVVGFEPGQYLGVELQPDSSDYREIRQYSLSDSPNGETYRISVKREQAANDEQFDGVVSNFLHDKLELGATLDLHPPAGDFFFVDRNKPVVLISAGVGLTPMQATLEHLYSLQYPQSVHYLHACLSPQQHSFAERVATICAEQSVQKEESKRWHAHTWYQQPLDDKALNQQLLIGSHRHQGYINLADIEQELPLDDGDFYLCGPVGFMKFIKEQLQALGVSEDSIHYEVFGPHEQF